MFSGIVAAVGRITASTPRNDGTPTVRLSIDAGRLELGDVSLGDSIACNGVCLTVVDKGEHSFGVDVSPETLSCTVGLESPGAINLEKALRLADFLELGELMARDALNREESCGGHFRIEHQTEEGEAKRDDENFVYAAVWEYKGEDAAPELTKEPLNFEFVHPAQRNYKD